MSKENKVPYWLKGGVIGAGIGLVSMLLVPVCASCEVFLQPVAWFVSFLAGELGLFFISYFPLAFLVFPVVVIVVWFIIGSIAGAAVGLLKKK